MDVALVELRGTGGVETKASMRGVQGRLGLGRVEVGGVPGG